MNFEEIMTFNSPYNQQNIDRLIEKIKSNCIVRYIGAGMSVLFDSVYPTWSSFLNSTFEQYFIDSEKEHYDSLNYEEKAQFLCSEMGRITFSDHLKDTFGEIHLERAAIDFLDKPVYILPVIFENGLLITTNYDRVIEKIYGLHEKMYTVVHPDIMKHLIVHLEMGHYYCVKFMVILQNLKRQLYYQKNSMKLHIQIQV